MLDTWNNSKYFKINLDPVKLEIQVVVRTSYEWWESNPCPLHKM